MENFSNKAPIFSRADILIPQAITDMSAYSVIACDQYTAQPDYWERVKARTADKFSTYSMVYPEVYLRDNDFSARIENINNSMHEAISSGLFTEYKNSFFYIQRTLRNGNIRSGLIGKIDLEEYDFSPDSKSHVRATEGTVLERIPPRVKIRENAPLELPHIMLLLDDPQRQIIEPLAQQTNDMQMVYDFKLMEESGGIKGFRLNDSQALNIEELLVNTAQSKPLSYAVGDGNHSLAAAKQCYLNLKEKIGEKALESPARYALCELVNLHDNSLEFEAIHRILLNSENDATQILLREYGISETCSLGSQAIEFAIRGNKKQYFICNPQHKLVVGSLQDILDKYVKKHGGLIDYIHGDTDLLFITKTFNEIGFLLPRMDKSDLFKAVEESGVLPRKTFSMGEAYDKRFYLEARKI